MPPSDPNKRNLRLPRDLAGRLQEEAAARGISQNDYLILALEYKLDADEERRKQRNAEAPRRPRRDKGPQGLGLRLPRLPVQADPPAPAIEPAAPVVVNVGTGGAAPGGSFIAGLADYIQGGRIFERDRRRRQVLEILREQGKSPGERDALEQQLAQALADKVESPPARLSPRPLGTIGSLFRQ